MRVVVLAGLAASLTNFRLELLESLIRNGHTVFAAAPSMDPRTEGALKRIGVTAIDVPLKRSSLNPLGDIRLCWTLRRLFANLRPDVVFNYTIKPVIYGSFAASLCRVPRIVSMVTGLGYCFLGETLKQRMVGCVAKLLYRAALRRNHVVIFQNRDDCGDFIERGVLAPSKETLIVNGSGVDLVKFALAEPFLSPSTFLLIARLYREKGVLEFVEAAQRLRRKHPQARCVVAGAPDSNPSSFTSADVEGWVATGAIEYVGWLEDVRPCLRTTSVYVLPSYREGTPRTVLEAMAMGRPIVTTDVPGCRETVAHGQNGFLVPAKDVESLAAAMERFVLEPALIRTMGLRSRRIAEEKYNVHDVNSRIVAALKLQAP